MNDDKKEPMTVDKLIEVLKHFNHFTIYFNGNSICSMTVNGVDKIINIDSRS